MMVDMNRKFVDMDGKDIMTPDGKLFTLRDAAKTALISAYQDEQSLSGEDKYARYETCMKIAPSGQSELSIEDISLIKQLIGKAFAAMIVGQAWDMLEGSKKYRGQNKDTIPG